jgi:hypothetical protein
VSREELAGLENDTQLDLLYMVKGLVDRAIDDHLDALYWKKDRDEWKRLYHELLDSSIKSSEELTANMLKAVLSGAIVPKKEKDDE